MAEEEKAQFALQRIYVKDASFESPKSPHGFRGQWKPKVNLELNSRHELIENSLYEVVLNVTVTAATEDDEVMYLVEVQQAGIFLVDGLEENARLHTLGSFCPNVLFPYAREVVDSMVLKGSFPPLMLNPVNFDAIYQQSLAEQARKEDKIQ
ncbi:MAG TPA: protein-export chaperone SecB [Gammaproteobacteria bacterium]|nr:protein-export chaperone SecB [Gammaproteobacteria bacterium]